MREKRGQKGLPQVCSVSLKVFLYRHLSKQAGCLFEAGHPTAGHPLILPETKKPLHFTGSGFFIVVDRRIEL
jgi:hypothetical protein